MADSTILLKVEEWIRRTALKKKYDQSFSKEKLPLQGKGMFECDAVSEDRSIVALISTSAAKTHSGKLGVGKIYKIRSDALWLFMLKKKPKHRILVFTDKTMFDRITSYQQRGRFPEEIKLLKVTLPKKLAHLVMKSHKGAGKEVTPKKTEQ